MAGGGAAWPPRTIAKAASRVASAQLRWPLRQADSVRVGRDFRKPHLVVRTPPRARAGYTLPYTRAGLIDYRLEGRASQLAFLVSVRGGQQLAPDRLDTAADLVNEISIAAGFASWRVVCGSGTSRCLLRLSCYDSRTPNSKKARRHKLSPQTLRALIMNPQFILSVA